MPLRPPPLSTSVAGGSPLSALEYELMAEKADALARAGVRVEKALEALRACPAIPENTSERRRLLEEAADLVWSFLVQREICGFRSQADAIKRYDIPHEVMIRLGAASRPTK
ncbi:hypothetical protein DFR48_107306 [Ciceribacter lividus]|uniref:Uncharacterized protein n=1 Tax=Ciceribacter lividus TaxID=1197950 RepID=A0A6I7HKQ8_9HYPH|nr:DUF6665 family protein [Ciceribacter lividus]RCW23432.1 hypothetical protein DFR48_107306 [Ciceribacter lividus]